jgi:hypothetical protein
MCLMVVLAQASPCRKRFQGFWWERVGSMSRVQPSSQRIPDVRAGQRSLVLPLSSNRFGGSDDRFLPVGVSFCRCRPGVVCHGAADPCHPQPRVINIDKAKCYPPAIHEFKEEKVLRKRCRHRPVQYLNNILEQDHRAIKKRIRAKQHFRQFSFARRTIQGYETMHKIRKGQVRWVKGDVRTQNRFIERVFGLTA